MVNLIPSDRKKIDDVIMGCFPDVNEIDDRLRTTVLVGLFHANHPSIDIDWTKYRREIEDVVTTERLEWRNGEVMCARKADGPYRYYKVASTHDREKPDFSPFTGHLHMARVSLPQSQPRTFKTAVGTVEPVDHLLGTIDEVTGKFGGLLGKPITRVDLITPPRSGGARFGAVSIYLGYEGGADHPSFYVLEAGTATGTPKRLFWAPALDHRIVDYTGYLPTPFSRETHVYVGRATFTGDSPKLIEISVHKDTASTPHIKLSVLFNETPDVPLHIWPGFLIARAAMILLDRIAHGVKKP